MPKQDGPLSAVVVSGGKQYRVGYGDRILVDRLEAAPGSEVRLDRVLLVADGGEVRVGTPLVDGFTLTARVIGHARGPRIEVLRYKSKKHVRVHRGARADLTVIEIIDPEAPAKQKAPKRKATARPKAAEKAAPKGADTSATESTADVAAPKPEASSAPRATAKTAAKEDTAPAAAVDTKETKDSKESKPAAPKKRTVKKEDSGDGS